MEFDVVDDSVIEQKGSAKREEIKKLLLDILDEAADGPITVHVKEWKDKYRYPENLRSAFNVSNSVLSKKVAKAAGVRHPRRNIWAMHVRKDKLYISCTPYNAAEIKAWSD